MSKLDRAKERIGYFKLWLGITVVTDISIFSWLFTSGSEASPVLIVSALIGAVFITIVVTLIHSRLAKEIDALEEL